eukprot:6212745-Pleurochrysis_carterae.AAC.5
MVPFPRLFRLLCAGRRACTPQAKEWLPARLESGGRVGGVARDSHTRLEEKIMHSKRAFTRQHLELSPMISS